MKWNFTAPVYASLPQQTRRYGNIQSKSRQTRCPFFETGANFSTPTNNNGQYSPTLCTNTTRVFQQNVRLHPDLLRRQTEPTSIPTRARILELYPQYNCIIPGGLINIHARTGSDVKRLYSRSYGHISTFVAAKVIGGRHPGSKDTASRMARYCFHNQYDTRVVAPISYNYAGYPT